MLAVDENSNRCVPIETEFDLKPGSNAHAQWGPTDHKNNPTKMQFFHNYRHLMEFESISEMLCITPDFPIHFWWHIFL